MRGTNRQSGFSLIELVIVLTILSVLLAGVVPVFRMSLAHNRKDQAVRDLIAYMKYAQERAVTDATEHRLYVDAEAGAFWVMRLAGRDGDEKRFEPVDQLADRRVLPESVKMRKPKAHFDREAKAHYIAFHPNGACDYATLRLRQGRHDRIAVKCEGNLDSFEVTEE